MSKTNPLSWHPHTSASDMTVIMAAPARYIGLRQRLRNHYWLNQCKPIGQTTVDLQRRLMAAVDPQDAMSDEQVAEVLSDHFGFLAVVEGWKIPDLDEHNDFAVQQAEGYRNRAQAGGRAKAARALEKQHQDAPIERAPTDF